MRNISISLRYSIHDVLKSNASAAVKLALIKEFDKVLGLDLIENAAKAAESEDNTDDIPEEIIALVEERKAARKEKNFALADEIREKIEALGYEVKETRQGTVLTKKG